MKTLLSLAGICVCTCIYAQSADSTQFYYKKGLDEKAAKRFLTASNAFEKALTFNSSFTEAYLENAYANLEMRKTDKAIANFVKVYEKEPLNNAAIKELMQLYFDYRQFAKAIEFAQKCIDCENAPRITGISYYQQEDYLAAEKALKTAIAKDPKDAEVTYTLARNYLDMEEYIKAVPYYEKAVSMDKTRNVWAYELGLLYYTNNDFVKAMNAFNGAADNGYIQSNDFKENLGYACLYSGEFDKGEKLLFGIWEKKPGNTTILRDMAEIFYQKKQYERSLTYCQKLMEIDAKDGKALYQAGLCFQKKGDKDKGQQMCDKAIEMDPSLQSLRKKSMDMSGM